MLTLYSGHIHQYSQVYISIDLYLVSTISIIIKYPAFLFYLRTAIVEIDGKWVESLFDKYVSLIMYIIIIFI